MLRAEAARIATARQVVGIRPVGDSPVARSGSDRRASRCSAPDARSMTANTDGTTADTRISSAMPALTRTTQVPRALIRRPAADESAGGHSVRGTPRGARREYSSGVKPPAARQQVVGQARGNADNLSDEQVLSASARAPRHGGSTFSRMGK